MSRMPSVFVGHGSPMIAIEEDQFTKGLEQLGKDLPIPKEILMISAHWTTKGSQLLNDPHPKMTYDMYGFPKELYEVVYDAPGSPELAKKVQDILGNEVTINNEWGFDHGAWTVLSRMFPDKKIPVTQLSVDSKASMKKYYDLGKKLTPLRDDGVLIIGSGNVVHNLAMTNFEMDHGYDWAEQFDNEIQDAILHKEIAKILAYASFGKSAAYSVPTTEHYAPLLYVLGAASDYEQFRVYNKGCTLGGISMTSYWME